VDDDGRHPDDSLVEVRYPRNKQEERGDQAAWPLLPGSILGQCGPDEWYAQKSASWRFWRTGAARRAGLPAGTCTTRAASGTAWRSGRTWASHRGAA
jgi:hypothetical protein